MFQWENNPYQSWEQVCAVKYRRKKTGRARSDLVSFPTSLSDATLLSHKEKLPNTEAGWAETKGNIQRQNFWLGKKMTQR